MTRRLHIHLIVHELAGMAVGERRTLDISRTAAVRRIAAALSPMTFQVVDWYNRENMRVYVDVERTA